MQHDYFADIATTARHLVDRHGAQALDIAIEQASRMEKIGNAARRTDWLCIMISAHRLLVSRHGW